MQLGYLPQVSRLVSSRAGSELSPRPPAHVWASAEGQGAWLEQTRVDVDQFGEAAGGTGEREGLRRGRQGMRSESQEVSCREGLDPWAWKGGRFLSTLGRSQRLGAGGEWHVTRVWGVTSGSGRDRGGLGSGERGGFGCGCEELSSAGSCRKVQGDIRPAPLEAESTGCDDDSRGRGPGVGYERLVT